MSKLLEATVVSAKMQKTIVVRIDRTFRHPRYRKVITKHKTYKVHCEDTSIKPGDLIVISETKPISKDKHFMFVKKLKSGVGPAIELKEVAAAIKPKIVPVQTKAADVPKKEVKPVTKKKVQSKVTKPKIA